MEADNWFLEELEKVQDTFEYKLQIASLDVTERIIERMESEGVSRSDLAKKLKVSKAAISKLLNKGSNLTLKRLLTIAEALNSNLKIELPQKESTAKATIRVDYDLKSTRVVIPFSKKGCIAADQYPEDSEFYGEQRYANGC